MSSAPPLARWSARLRVLSRCQFDHGWSACGRAHTQSWPHLSTLVTAQGNAEERSRSFPRRLPSPTVAGGSMTWRLISRRHAENAQRSVRGTWHHIRHGRRVSDAVAAMRDTMRSQATCVGRSTDVPQRRSARLSPPSDPLACRQWSLPVALPAIASLKSRSDWSCSMPGCSVPRRATGAAEARARCGRVSDVDTAKAWCSPAFEALRLVLSADEGR